MKKLLFGFLCVLILTGCITTGTTPSIVCRDVPISPSFVVIPFNKNQVQVTCAEDAERALMSLGVRVLAPPKPKNIEQKLEAGGKQTTLNKGSNAVNSSSVSVAEALASKTRIERYSIGETSADYIITTNGIWYYYEGQPYIENVSIRIMKIDSEEILSSFKTYPDNILDEMYKVLKAMGMNVKKPN
jgi:hypothetical protein